MEGREAPIVRRPAARQGPAALAPYAPHTPYAPPSFSTPPLLPALAPVTAARTSRRLVVPGFRRIKPAIHADGVSPDELFVRRIGTANAAQTERLLERELFRSTGQHVALDFRDGDPDLLRPTAIGIAHWMRLHEVKLPSVSVTRIPQDGHGITAGDASWIGGIRLDTCIFGTRRAAGLEDLLLQGVPLTHPAHGNLTAYAVTTVFHELDHLRQNEGGATPPDILEADFAAAKAEEAARREKGFLRAPTFPRGYPLEHYLPRAPELAAISGASAERQLGSHAATGKAELSAEGTAVGHWSGANADWVSRSVTTALDDFPRIAAAAPGMRTAVAAVSPSHRSVAPARQFHRRLDLSQGRPRDTARARDVAAHRH